MTLGGSRFYLLCSPACPGTPYVGQELRAILSLYLTPECWVPGMHHHAWLTTDLFSLFFFCELRALLIPHPPTPTESTSRLPMLSLLGEHDTSHLLRWLCCSSWWQLAQPHGGHLAGPNLQGAVGGHPGARGFPASSKTPPVPGSTHPCSPTPPLVQAVPCSGSECLITSFPPGSKG